MKLSILFYHPKNPQNLWDAASIAEALNLNLYLVPRPNANYKLDRLPQSMRRNIIVLNDLSELRRYEPSAKVLLLETYANKLITEVSIEPSKSVVLVFGAEDYGIPPSEAEKLGEREELLIPVAVEGMSYNVVASIVMALYEVKLRAKNLEGCEGKRS